MILVLFQISWKCFGKKWERKRKDDELATVDIICELSTIICENNWKSFGNHSPQNEINEYYVKKQNRKTNESLKVFIKDKWEKSKYDK